jgi:hypothetical protein
MPFGWVSAGSALVGAGSTLYNDFKGGSGSKTGQTGSMYVPTGLGGADQQWQQNSATNQDQLNGFAGQVDPNISSAYQQLSNIDYQPYLQASQQAGSQYGQLANTVGQYGGQMAGQAQNDFGQQQALQQAGQSVYNLGMDPQNALYNRTQQQITDQSAASNSMYGLGSSGQGAALQNQANENFNIDWQNQQLARASQGLQGMTSANQAAGAQGTLGSAALQQSAGYYGQQPGYTQQAASTPMNAQQQVGQQGFTNAQNYSTALGSAMAPYDQQQNQNIPYMNYGSGAGSNAFQNTLAGQQAQNNALQQAGSALGNTNWSQLSNLFGGSGGSNLSGNGYGGYGTSGQSGAVLYGDGYGPG